MDRETTAPECELVNVTDDEQNVVIEWADGHHSRYHFLWLRDACQCKFCGIPGFGDKAHAVVDLPEDIHHLSAQIGAEGALIVEWSGKTPHRSSYEGVWLRAHCYSKSERERRRSKPLLWNTFAPPDITPIDYERLVNDESIQFDLLERLRVSGLAIIRGAPAVQGVAGVAACVHRLSTRD